MKKLLTSLVLVAALLCSMGGMVYADETDGLLDQPPMGLEQFVPGTVPAQSAQIDGMIPPVNAMLLSMLEHELTYDESCNIFMWNGIYYMISLYGEMDSRAEITDEFLILPSETVADYAAALFHNYNGLPALPAELSDRVVYDPDADCYFLARGDAGLSELVITNTAVLENGTLEVSGGLFSLDDNSEQCAFTAELVANHSMFGYSICDMTVE